MSAVIATPYAYAALILLVLASNPSGRVRVTTLLVLLTVGLVPWLIGARRAGANGAQMTTFTALWAVAATCALVWWLAAMRGPALPPAPPAAPTATLPSQTPTPPTVHAVRINGKYTAQTPALPHANRARYLRAHYRRQNRSNTP